MGVIYKGVGDDKTAVGSYACGIVFDGVDEETRNSIGEYWIGTIYKGTGWDKKAVASWTDGKIYKGTGWRKTEIGSYSDGVFYLDTEYGKMPLGSYDEEEEGFAAAAYLLLF